MYRNLRNILMSLADENNFSSLRGNVFDIIHLTSARKKDKALNLCIYIQSYRENTLL